MKNRNFVYGKVMALFAITTLNIEARQDSLESAAEPREEFNINTTRGWVAGHAMRIIGEYLLTLEDHPNPPTPNLVNF